ncbi:MAG: hypothetical protein JEZ12_06895 [Desulfobacterium sp.]|nr:hypothetical protein [Desulfobacterium sp.]
MALGFFNNRGTVRQEDYLQPIKQMLEQTWDLSRAFLVPADPILARGIGIFNLFFRKLNGIVANILKSVVVLSAMAPGLFRFATEFRDRCLEQEKMMGNISRAGVRMATSVGKIAENTETLAVDSENIEKQVREALALQENSMGQFDEIKTFVADLVCTIQELDDHSNSIGTIIDMIGNISDETTILSLNARIEAARTSGNSKGFKVIAEEMDTLAKQTKAATMEIQERVGRLRATVTGTVDAVKNVEKNVQAGEALIGNANTSLKHVYSGFESLAGNLALIQDATSLQSRDVKTVSDDILVIEGSMKRQSKTVETIVTTAENINHLCDDMIVDTGIFHLSTHQVARGVAETMARDQGLSSMARAAREKALAGFLEQYGFIELAYITDGTGRQVTGNVDAGNTGQRVTGNVEAGNPVGPNAPENGYGRNWSAKEWFREPERHGSTFVSKVYRSSATDRFCFTVSVPLFDKKRMFSGVLAIDINYEDILTVNT